MISYYQFLVPILINQLSSWPESLVLKKSVKTNNAARQAIYRVAQANYETEYICCQDCSILFQILKQKEG